MKIHLWQCRNLSYIKTIGACLKTRCRIFCYRKTYFHMENKAKIIFAPNSILHLNRSHYPSKYHTDGLLYLKENSVMEIRGRVAFGDGMKITLHSGSQCQLNDCVINNHCDIGIKSKLYIGAGTLIGDYCSIHDFDGHKIMNETGDFIEGISEIHIGRNVWIGEKVTILKGVSIGDNSIIGAGSLVTKDVPDGVLVVGNPCRILRENVFWKE